jgi:glycosyltransferase involved in cell wall biosynthesis
VWVQEPRDFFAADVAEAGARSECVFENPGWSWPRRSFFRVCRLLASGSHVWMALALVTRLRRERPAVLHCLLDTTNVAGALAGRMAGVPVVIAGLLSLHPGERRTAAATRFQRRCYRLLRPSLVDAVIANSESGWASFVRLEAGFPKDRVRVVWPGLEPAPLSAATDDEIRGRLDIAPDLPVVLWAGRLAPEKRVDVLLRACLDLVARRRPFLTLVVGEGREGPALEALAADLGLSEHVRFLGVRRDIPDLLRVARVTALTSEIEGLPTILLEAQLAGCPVVATRAGGTSELVEDGVTGFLAPIGDHVAIASHLARLLDDPALAARMGRAGAERCRRLFGATRMGEETLAIYRELLERRGVRVSPDWPRDLAEVRPRSPREAPSAAPPRS